MARSYPKVVVDGFDLDEASIDLARGNATAAGLADRVTFHVRDAGGPELAGPLRPGDGVRVPPRHGAAGQRAAPMRQLAGERGAVLVVDERVGETFTRPGNDVEWMMYGWSVLHCLPVGMADTPSAETGTVMRAARSAATRRRRAFAAWRFSPIDNLFFRFYRLHAE